MKLIILYRYFNGCMAYSYLLTLKDVLIINDADAVSQMLQNDNGVEVDIGVYQSM